MGIAIPNFSTTKQLKDSGRIPFLELKIKGELARATRSDWRHHCGVFCRIVHTRNSFIEEGSLSFIPRLVTDEINKQLMGEFMEWAIQEALDQMNGAVKSIKS